MAGNQIIDRRVVAIPGPTGSVTPEAVAARNAAKEYRDQAEAFSATTQTLQDAAVSELLATDSQTRTTLDAVMTASWLQRAQFDRSGQAALTALGDAAKKRLVDAGDLSGQVTLVQPPVSQTLWRVQLPDPYDQSIAAPLVIWLHNNGGSATNGATDVRLQPLMFGLRDAGFIVASASVGSSWSTDAARGEVERLYEHVRATYPVSTVVLVGVSMGGHFALNILPRLEIPNIVAYLGMAGVASMQDLYESGYKPAIDAAWGVTSFASIPDSVKPELRAGHEFRGVPMMLVHSPDDATCHIANSQALIDRVAPFAPGSQLVESTGAHMAQTQAQDAVTYGIPFLLEHAPVGDTPKLTWGGLSRSWMGAALPAASSAVASWVDSTSGVNLSQATAASQPVVAAQGSVKYVHFDGVDDFLAEASDARPAVETIVLAFRIHSAVSAARRFFMGSGVGSTSFRTAGVSRELTNYVMSDGAAISCNPPIAPDSEWHIAVYVHNAAWSVISIDGVDTSATTGATSDRHPGWRLATGYGGNAVGATPIDVAEMHVFHKAASTRQRQAILQDMRTRLADLFA